MVRHIIMLNYREEFSPEQNRENARLVKKRLEGLKGIIPGIIEFKVIAETLPGSNMDIVFNTLFESEEALAAYQVHPAHVEAANFVVSVMKNRSCIDYYEQLR